MAVEFRNEWQDIRVELLKTLRGYELEGVDEDSGSVNYVTGDEESGRRLLRVLVDEDRRAKRAGVKDLEETLRCLKEGGFEEITVVAEDFPKGSKNIVNSEPDINMISEGTDHFNMAEIRYAAQEITWELRTAKCRMYPTSLDECSGYADGHYSCDVRRVSDDADFHAEREWKHLLYEDFKNLVSL
ncbi:MAG TPA: hypothetical protein VM050_10490 [Patescibacteria group bacterium]|nr:hypothetical protein [Patescibacteria group bacterium]